LRGKDRMYPRTAKSGPAHSMCREKVWNEGTKRSTNVSSQAENGRVRGRNFKGKNKCSEKSRSECAGGVRCKETNGVHSCVYARSHNQRRHEGPIFENAQGGIGGKVDFNSRGRSKGKTSILKEACEVLGVPDPNNRRPFLRRKR